MATERATGSKQGGYLGRVLIAVGVAAILIDLAFLTHPLAHLLESAKSGTFGIVPALGMSFLDAARAVALHQVDYFSLVSRILVLFFALVAVVVGTTLLRARQAPADTVERTNLPRSSEGDR